MKKNLLKTMLVNLAIVSLAACGAGSPQSSTVADATVGQANQPAYTCVQKYFDLATGKDPIFTHVHEVNLTADNFRSPFVPMSPQENWTFAVQSNRASTPNPRPGSTGAFGVPGMDDNHVRFALSHNLEFVGAETWVDKAASDVYLRYSFPRANPFVKASWMEVSCTRR